MCGHRVGAVGVAVDYAGTQQNYLKQSSVFTVQYCTVGVFTYQQFKNKK